MPFKKLKSIIILLIISLLIIPTFTYAYSSLVIPGGEPLGIALNTKGILVVGEYEVNGKYPARDADIKTGDIIISINNIQTKNINDMVKQISKNDNNTTIEISVLRNNKIFNTKLTLLKDKDNVYKTGLYVKDSITGLGTLTFINPNTNKFGALGHEIIETTTKEKLEIKDGKIFKAEINGIEKSIRGNPGEKTARFYSDIILGNISSNKSSGIYGTYTGNFPEKQALEVALPSEIKLGEASMLTAIEMTNVEAFKLNIIKINANDVNGKNILFEINDNALIEKTGGIVQGMSGSPIIQNNKIIGAVTHVVVDDTYKGYGIFITTMLKESEI